MATSTSKLVQLLENVDEKVLKCSICFKRLQNPKSLNCLHSFCLSCLEDWVKTKGELICPTCSKSYPIPDGGLQKLPPNAFINKLLENIEQFSGTDQLKCFCAKGNAKYYCQECRHYLCCNCSDYHKILPMSANHKLHFVEDVRPMTPLQIAMLQLPMCSLHNEPLKFFCSICNIPICMHCTIIDHKEWEGNHKPISISKAFRTFKETAATLEKEANDIKNKLQDGLTAIIHKTTKLDQSKYTSLRDIDNHVQKMLKEIKENGDKMKNEVETIYKEKKAVLDVQMDELKKTVLDINTKLNFLNELLKSDEATAMQSSEIVITALKEIINDLPETDTKDDEEFNFYINKNQIESLQACDIGYVSEMRAADRLKLKEREVMLYGTDDIHAHIIGAIDYEDKDIYQLKATYRVPTGETIIGKFSNDWGTIYADLVCRDPGVYELDVKAYGESIKNSPMTIKVENAGLVNTIKINVENVRDVVKCEDGCLLVSCLTNEMLKYKQSGEYIGKVILPQGVQVDRMYKIKNGIIVFSDYYNKCIRVCNMNGLVVKSIGQRVLKAPTGIHVDEKANIVYVGDRDIGCVFMFDISSGHVIEKIGSKGTKKGQLGSITDVTLTNKGHILILENDNNRLQLFDKEGRFLKVLVESSERKVALKYPCGVVVDEDDRTIIASNHTLQIFSSNGYSINRIDDEEDGIKNPCGLSIISYNPLSVAVANTGDGTIKIFNYRDTFSNFIMHGWPC